MRGCPRTEPGAAGYREYRGEARGAEGDHFWSSMVEARWPEPSSGQRSLKSRSACVSSVVSQKSRLLLFDDCCRLYEGSSAGVSSRSFRTGRGVKPTCRQPTPPKSGHEVGGDATFADAILGRPPLPPSGWGGRGRLARWAASP